MTLPLKLLSRKNIVVKTHVNISRAFVDSHFGRDFTDNLNSGNRLRIHRSGSLSSQLNRSIIRAEFTSLLPL